MSGTDVNYVSIANQAKFSRIELQLILYVSLVMGCERKKTDLHVSWSWTERVKLLLLTKTNWHLVLAVVSSILKCLLWKLYINHQSLIYLPFKKNSGHIYHWTFLVFSSSDVLSHVFPLHFIQAWRKTPFEAF